MIFKISGLLKAWSLVRSDFSERNGPHINKFHKDIDRDYSLWMYPTHGQKFWLVTSNDELNIFS